MSTDRLAAEPLALPQRPLKAGELPMPARRRPAPVSVALSVALRRLMRQQRLALRVSTMLLLSFPVAVLAGIALRRLGFDPHWLEALVERRAVLLLLAMIFAQVALCDSVIRRHTQWQFVGEIGLAIALGYLTRGVD
jgi:hypothetical protein